MLSVTVTITKIPFPLISLKFWRSLTFADFINQWGNHVRVKSIQNQLVPYSSHAVKLI